MAATTAMASIVFGFLRRRLVELAKSTMQQHQSARRLATESTRRRVLVSRHKGVGRCGASVGALWWRCPRSMAVSFCTRNCSDRTMARGCSISHQKTACMRCVTAGRGRLDFLEVDWDGGIDAACRTCAQAAASRAPACFVSMCRRARWLSTWQPRRQLLRVRLAYGHASVPVATRRWPPCFPGRSSAGSTHRRPVRLRLARGFKQAVSCCAQVYCGC
jgi:hypothetical protein